MDNLEQCIDSLNEIVKAIKSEGSEEWGLVLYTDGGARDYIEVSSWGLHGYIYDHVERKAGYGLKKCAPTTAGYMGPGIRLVDDDGKELRKYIKHRLEPQPVRIRSYIDAHEPMGSYTNNYAETKGLLTALKMIDALRPPRTQLVLDSEYAMKGALLWNKKWAKNNYVKPDGSPVANAELWVQIGELMDKFEAEKFHQKISWDWVKGHRDDIGNNAADLASNKGMNASTNSHDKPHFKLSEIGKYWSPVVELNPLMKEPRLYMLVHASKRYLPAERTYFFGNVGPKDDVEGKPSSDRGYSVIHLNEPCPVISSIFDYFKENCLVDKDLFVARFRNDLIIKPKTYRDILEHGTKFFEPDKKQQIICDAYSRTASSGLGEMITPANVSYNLSDNLSKIEYLLADYLEGKFEGETIEITDKLYEKITKKKAEVNSYIASNKAALGVETTLPERDDLRLVALSYGIDLPSQGTLRAVVNLNPRVFFIHWKDTPITRRHATVLHTDNGIGLWCGIYSNRIYLTKE